MAIEMVKVRAIITVGGSIQCATPDLVNYPDGIIQSFNVSKSRGKSSTFSANLKIRYNVLSQNNVIGDVKIEAGVEGNLITIFNGYIQNSKTSPCNDDPSYVMLNISGADVLSRLDGMKYSRRQTGSKACWVTIDGVSRQGLRSGKFAYQKRETILTTDTDLTDVGQVTRTHGVQDKVWTDNLVNANTKDSNDGRSTVIATYES